MLNTHELLLVNIIGHSAGAIIFGIFLFLLLRDRAGRGMRGAWRSFMAAGLAFLWNACSLAMLVITIRAGAQPVAFMAFTFSILSALPAVLLDISLTSNLRPLVRIGYALTAIAVVLHFAGPAGFRSQQTTAFLIITVGFAILTAVALLALTLQHDSKGRPKTMAGAMCSALFAISFVHFSSGEPAGAWSNEIALHHAGLPLALFVLLQDYRFLLLDAFTRFLANVLVAALLTFAVIRAASYLVLLNHSSDTSNPLYQALLLIGICGLLIVFALLRGTVQRWLTKVVFRRPDLEKALRDLRSGPSPVPTEPEYLAWAAERLAGFMGADNGHVEAALPGVAGTELVSPITAADIPALRREPGFEGVEAVVPVRLGPGEMRFLVLGRRVGGRRYLSEDLIALGRLSAAITEQVDQLRTGEMQRLVSQAELRALQSQINPHFLFNALNALYGVIPREAAGARRTVTNLSQVFRYFLQADRTFIPLSEEIEIVKAYLEIESLRLGARMQTDIQIDNAALPVLIPVLSIQPLVENAVRHGIAPSPRPAWVRLRAEACDNLVRITVQDTGKGMGSASTDARDRKGVGLGNVTRRLKLCYGPEADLGIESSSEGTTIRFSVPRALAAKAV